MCNRSAATTKITRALGQALVTVATLACVALVQAGSGSLQDQIRKLALEHNFVVSGLDQLGDAPAKPVEGNPRQQVKALLEGFNHVTVDRAMGGGIERLIITSAKRSAASAAAAAGVSTTRRGRHHLVSAVLIGPSSARHTVSLLIDTGASNVVLPTSMMEPLGFREADLRSTWSQTANGKVRTLQGRLDTVRVGPYVVEGVGVNFVDDEALGGSRLLGMSFLRRFRVTIDDENKRLILISK